MKLDMQQALQVRIFARIAATTETFLALLMLGVNTMSRNGAAKFCDKLRQTLLSV